MAQGREGNGVKRIPVYKHETKSTGKLDDESNLVVQTSREQDDENVQDKALVFIVDRVRGAPNGDGSLRFTGYHQRTGKVINTRNSGLVWSTTPVKSNIKQGYFIFGEQEMSFYDVMPEEDMILIIRFYHWPNGNVTTAPWDINQSMEKLMESEEWLVAWGVLRLSSPADSHALQTQSHVITWNTGTHTVALFHGPVPSPHDLLVLPGEHLRDIWEPYGNATVRLHLFTGSRPSALTIPDSPADTNTIKEWPTLVYIHHARKLPPSLPFTGGDGFDLYIDGARFLPDAVTISRVTGRMFNRNYNQIGPDISSGIDLNSNIFEPFYNHRTEFRNPRMPPSATLLLKVYAIDRFSLKLVLIGWAALNVFVESGNETIPTVDSGVVQISLNEGAHQLRLYYDGPDPDKPLSVNAITVGGRYIPCATLLVRLVKVQTDKNLQALERDKVPKSEWTKLGLFQPRPNYEDKVYYSDKARPTTGENDLCHTMLNRSFVSVREIVPMIIGTKEQEFRTDIELQNWIHMKLSKLVDDKPLTFNMTYISRYLTTYGIKLSVDRANNLPWDNFTLAHTSFNPPGAYYYGSPWAKYDHPAFIDNIDFDSPQKCPIWLDNFKSFPGRVYNKYLTVIVHLHEVVVSPLETNALNYEMKEQAWTALQVFSKGYCNTAIYHLPLYQGAPNQDVLAALARGDCQSVLDDLVHKNTIFRLRGASVLVRIADGRRDEELARYSEQHINQSYLSSELIEQYEPEPSNVLLRQLIPAGLSVGDFKKQLSQRFRELVSSC
ncbi:uncharacterized protein LOC127567700 [Pristis pectinata]|uniref:uncharacterized protein LOC127567700 n=1 Tax=Pristis pectinata TaxID=685728 RepID=UPI00223D9ED7|nr:uncharacterized protein LOC127567700 [Pristis pectinata]